MSVLMNSDNKTLINELSRHVGSHHVLTDPAKTARYRKGFRSGQGEALAVVFPGSLLELWRVLSACVAADKIIIMPGRQHRPDRRFDAKRQRLRSRYCDYQYAAPRQAASAG